MNSKRLKIGIIGCGTIGSEIARACIDKLANKIDLFAICDLDEKKTALLGKLINRKIKILDLEDIIEKSDFIVEAASAAVAAKVLGGCIRRKKACLIMSVGGLLGKEDLLKSAGEKGVEVFIPSGAICGIDGLKAASIGRIDKVVLTTRKPPKGLAGAPYLKDKNIDLGAIKRETVLFEGPASEAVKGFPKNINVSAVLSLAGVGAKKTFVRIVTSPDYTGNTHEIEIAGEFGNIVTRAENLPSRANPKTSALAVMSAIATLESAVNSVRIGT